MPRQSLLHGNESNAPKVLKDALGDSKHIVYWARPDPNQNYWTAMIYSRKLYCIYMTIYHDI